MYRLPVVFGELWVSDFYTLDTLRPREWTNPRTPLLPGRSRVDTDYPDEEVPPLCPVPNPHIPSVPSCRVGDPAPLRRKGLYGTP